MSAKGKATRGVEPHSEVSPVERNLTTDDLAEYLVLSRRTVMRLLASGRGPRATRFGRAVRFRMDEVRRWQKQIEKSGGVNFIEPSVMP